MLLSSQVSAPRPIVPVPAAARPSRTLQATTHAPVDGDKGNLQLQAQGYRKAREVSLTLRGEAEAADGPRPWAALREESRRLPRDEAAVADPLGEAAAPRGPPARDGVRRAVREGVRIAERDGVRAAEREAEREATVRGGAREGGRAAARRAEGWPARERSLARERL